MITFPDQTGQIVVCQGPPKKVVSLVPSISETLVHCMGIYALAGVTKFCEHPKELRNNAVLVGGTKNPDISAIKALMPDIVLANKEENRQEDIDAIRQFCQVYVSDIKEPADAVRWLWDMEKLFSESRFGQLAVELQSLYSINENTTCRAAYLIWKKPWMTVGGDTFIHAMMAHFGIENVFGNKSRYPVTHLEEIRNLQPDFILLSSEPFPFRQKHVAEMQTFFHNAGILLVDGALFSWYGSRMLLAKKEIPAMLNKIYNR